MSASSPVPSVSSWVFSSGPPTPMPPTPPDLSPLPSPPPSSPPTPPPIYPRHPEYYIEDDMAVVLVDECLFKVHRYFLIRESPLWRSMFDLPAGQADVEGMDDATPISLPQVTRQEFESLLQFLYKGMHDEDRLNLPQWIEVLSISTRFICDRIRERAIREIDQHRPRINPIEKVVLAFRHNIPEWLAPSYEAICQRPHPLEVYEAEKLGLVITTLLARAREAVRQEAKLRTSPPSVEPVHDRPWERAWPGLTVPEPYEPYDHRSVKEIVSEVFWPDVPPWQDRSPGGPGDPEED